MQLSDNQKQLDVDAKGLFSVRFRGMTRFAERVSTAMQSDDLTLRLDRACDVDVLVALGWIAQREPLGSALLRLQLTNDVEGLGAAIARGEEIALGIKRKWNLPKGERFWRRFAAAGVSYWLNSLCRRCSGRMFEVIEGTPKLSTTRCLSCGGTGRRRYPKIADESMEDDFWRDRFAELLNTLDAHAERTLSRAKFLLTARVNMPN
jgi:hypothetical protein